jgi:HTH-type transcriptional regulator, sugar sensing transcriptional regulator
MLSKELEKIGLNQNEAKVYLAALELNESTIQQISKKSGVIRTTVYGVVMQLKERGLISSLTRNKKTLYIAESPTKLKDDLKEKEYFLEKILPELLSVTNALDKKPKIRFFEGIGGLKDIYLDTLNYPDQELLAWIAEEHIEYFDKEFLYDYYIPERVKRKIWVRAIAPDNPLMARFKEEDEKSLRKTRFVSEESFPFDVEINLYGKNRIGIVAFEEKIGLIIESQKIYTTLKSIFEMNWRALESRNKAKENDIIENT